MSLKDIQERLREDPEAVFIDMAGEERPFLLSTLGMERARQKKDPLPALFSLVQRYAFVINQFQDGASLADEEMQSEIERRIKGDDLSDLSVVLWSGFLTFDEEITLEEVQLVMTPGRIFRSGMEIAQALMSFLKDIDENQIPDEVGTQESGN